jgi:hypothetical protein
MAEDAESKYVEHARLYHIARTSTKASKAQDTCSKAVLVALLLTEGQISRKVLGLSHQSRKHQCSWSIA